MRFTSHPAPPPFAARPRAAAALALALAPALVLGGCSDLVRAARLQPEGVNVESPAAAIVQAAQARRTAFPSFGDVPPTVADATSDAAYRRYVGRLSTERADFRSWEAQNPAPSVDTEGFATSTRGGVATGGVAAPGVDQTKSSTDWARRARDAARLPAPAAVKP